MRSGDGSSDVGSSDLAAVGLNHSAIDHDLALAELLHIDDGAQTTPDKPLDFLRPTRLLALRRLARAARMRRAGQHAIFGGHPARALAAHPRRQLGRAHVCTPVTNAHLVCRLLLETKKTSTDDKFLQITPTLIRSQT